MQITSDYFAKPVRWSSEGPGHSMQIPGERAFWILDFYRRHGTKLRLAAGLSDLKSSAYLTITTVSPTLHWINVCLFDDVAGEKWNRDISLSPARYFLSQMGDPSFMNDCVGCCNCHSALRVEFADGEMLCFTERVE
jgi:hypothetical protein